MSLKFRFLSLFVLFSFVLTYLSCRKTDLYSQNTSNNDAIIVSFYKHSDSINPAIKKVLSKFEEYNFTSEQLNSFVEKYGFPLWDKCLMLKNDNSNNFSSLNSNSDSTIIIPLCIPNETKIVTYLETNIDSTLLISLHMANEYTNNSFSTSSTNLVSAAEKVALKLMLINKEVFGHKNFLITDKRLFHGNTNYQDTTNKRRIIKIVQNSNNILSNSICVVTTTTTTDYHCNQKGSCVSGVCDLCYLCYNVSSSNSYYCASLGDGNVTSYPPTIITNTGNGTGGVGGSNTNNNTGFTPVVYNPAIAYLGTTMQMEIDGEEALWFMTSNIHSLRATEMKNYLVTNNNSAAAIALCWAHLNKMRSNLNYLSFVNSNPNDIQTAYYSYLTEVEDNLLNPCLKSIIADIESDGLKSIIFDLYKRAQAVPDFKIKIIYEEVSYLTNNAPGNTIDSYSGPNGYPTSGTMKIQLNTTVLNGKSKEYISSVVLHEICHAILKSSNALNSGPPNIPQIEEHRKLIQFGYPIKIYNALKELYPNLPNATALEIATKDSDFKDLAIGGLGDENLIFAANNILLNNALTSQITSSNYFPNININNAYFITIPDYKNLTNGKGTICN